jgi:hypothetical protein
MTALLPQMRPAGNRRDPASLRPQPRRDGADFWPTPACLIWALIHHVLSGLPPRPLLEFAAGDGRLVHPLRAAGYTVLASDIAPRGEGIERRDFLHDEPLLRGAIGVSNSPYNQLDKFLARGLQLLDCGQLTGLVLLVRTDALTAAGVGRGHHGQRTLVERLDHVVARSPWAACHTLAAPRAAAAAGRAGGAGAMSDSQQVAAPRTERLARLLEWRPWPFENPSLIGHCAVAFAGGWEVREIPVFRRADGSLSVGTPEAAEIDRDGRVKLKPDGKRSYRKLITFASNEARERWRRMVLFALAEGGIGPGERTP